MAATATQGTMSGLPRRLVQDGIVSEADLASALDESQRSGTSLVPILVARQLGTARRIAVAAAHEFGVPLLDRPDNADNLQDHGIHFRMSIARF